MKLLSTKCEATQIANESFALLNFDQLPWQASPDMQIAALRDDQRWQADHHNEVSKRIDYLIDQIRNPNDHPPQ